MKKKKVFVLMISKVFPAYHPRKGQCTNFRERIFIGQNKVVPMHTDNWKDAISSVWPNAEIFVPFPKITTIRSNYALWAKRAEKINRGEAVLSLRQWTGSPYNYKRDGSKQVEFLRLEKIGVQKAKVISGSVAPGIPKSKAVFVDSSIKNIHEVAKNDGLSVDDFCNWFKKDMEGVIIHFTEKFRY